MEPRRSSDIDLLTLTIAAVASAAAAYVTSQVWADGTLVSAALTPVIVALVKEGLNKPVERVQTRRIERREDDERPPRDPARWWRVALVSGLAAFALVVAVFTVPELVTGQSIGRGGDHATTFFGGKERKQAKDKRSDEPATGGKAKPAATATPSPSPTPSPTPTPTPSPTPSPTPATASPLPTVTP